MDMDKETVKPAICWKGKGFVVADRRHRRQWKQNYSGLMMNLEIRYYRELCSSDTNTDSKLAVGKGLNRSAGCDERRKKSRHSEMSEDGRTVDQETRRRQAVRNS
jgi:hypothetical protein